MFPLTISLMLCSKSWMCAGPRAPRRHSGETTQRKWELFPSGQTSWCFLLLQADQSQVVRAPCTLRPKPLAFSTFACQKLKNKRKNCLLSDPSYFIGLKISAASKAASVSWALGFCSETAQKALQKLSWVSVSSYLSASLTPWEFLPLLIPKCICQRTPWRLLSVNRHIM